MPISRTHRWHPKLIYFHEPRHDVWRKPSQLNGTRAPASSPRSAERTARKHSRARAYEDGRERTKYQVQCPARSFCFIVDEWTTRKNLQGRRRSSGRSTAENIWAVSWYDNCGHLSHEVNEKFNVNSLGDVGETTIHPTMLGEGR